MSITIMMLFVNFAWILRINCMDTITWTTFNIIGHLSSNALLYEVQMRSFNGLSGYKVVEMSSLLFYWGYNLALSFFLLLKLTIGEIWNSPHFLCRLGIEESCNFFFAIPLMRFFPKYIHIILKARNGDLRCALFIHWHTLSTLLNLT